jgi:hypothetical protein
VCLVLLLALAVACASSAKQRAVVAYQGADAAFSAFQDTERALYAAKTIPTLDAKAHERISIVLARAFGVQEKAGLALLIWETGEPVPADVMAYFNEAERVIRELDTVVPDHPALTRAAEIVRWARMLVELAKQLRVTPPAQVALVAEGGR